MIWLYYILGLLLNFFGCQTLNLIIDGSDYNTILVGEYERKYLLYKPLSLKDNYAEVPLFVIFHGATYSSKLFFEQTDWHLVAEDKKFIVLYVEGHCTIGEVNCCWNTGTLYALTPENRKKDDILFVDNLLDFILYEQTEINIDKNKVILSGFSSGAAMVYTYVINTTKHDIYGIAPVAGHIGGITPNFIVPTIHYDPNNFPVPRNNKLHVLSIMSEDDIQVTIDGGPTFLGGEEFSLKKDIDYCIRQNGECSEPNKKVEKLDMFDENNIPFLNHTCYGGYCNDKLICSVLFKDVVHSWSSYEKKLNNEDLLRTGELSKYSRALAEYIFYFFEYDSEKKSYPEEDPDPIPPNDNCPLIWWLFNRCPTPYNGSNGIIQFSFLILVFLFLINIF